LGIKKKQIVKRKQVMSIIKSQPDGDCFYHSVINGLKHNHHDNLTPRDIKLKVAEYIKNDPSLHQDLLIEWRDFGVIDKNKQLLLDETLHIITNTNEWAVSTIIHIVSLIFQIQIVVHTEINSKFHSESFPSFWKEKTDVNSEGGFVKFIPKQRIHILKKGNHYDLIVPKVVEKENSQTSMPLVSLALVITLMFIL
jgi:hypothetical protein